MEIGQSVKIGRPLAEVFAFVADLGNWPRWQPDAEDGSLPKGPAEVGTSFRQAFRTSGGRVELLCNVIGYEEGRRLSFSYTRQDASFLIDYLFEPEDRGTRLIAAGHGQLTGFYKLFEPLVEREMNARINSSLATLKDLLEGKA